MIGTARKPEAEILEAIDKYRKIIVAGCNGCAKVCKTGGEAEVASMAEELCEHGKAL